MATPTPTPSASVTSTPTPTPTPAAAASVSVTPATVTLMTGGAQTFSATVTNATDQSVIWSVEEGASGGSITAAGVYTAPNNAGTYHVIATSVADTSKVAIATITVQTAPVSVSVAVIPSTATLSVGGSKTFTATVSGSSNIAVTWSVQEGATGGTVTSAGVYTAPATSGTYHLLAISSADGTAVGSATITVQSGSGAITIQ